MAKRRERRRSPGTGIIRPLKNGRTQALYPDGAGGHISRTFDTVADAEAWLAQQHRHKEARLSVDGGQKRLGAWMQQWLDARPAHLKQTTIADYTFKIGYLAPLRDVALMELTADAVDDLMRDLGKSLSETTVKQVRGLLSRALDEAVRRKYVAHNVAVAERTRRPRKKIPRRVLRAGEARGLCEAATGPYAAAWPLLCVLGLRAAELCGLRLVDVDLDARTLTIAQQWTDVRGVGKVQGEPKYESARVLPLPAAHVAALAAALESAAPSAYHLLFPGRGGRPLLVTSLRHMLRRLTDARALPPVTTHQLRNTAAQFLADAGCPEEVRAAILGHTPQSITQHYATPGVEVMRPWVEKVWTVVFGEAGQVRRSA